MRGLPAVDRDPGAAPGHSAVGKGHPRRRDPPRRGGRLRRHEGVRGRRAAVVPPAQPRPRHRPVPGGVLPDLRHGRPAGRAAGRAGPRRRRAGAWTWTAVDPADAARASAPVGQLARQPGRAVSTTWPRWRDGAGSGACRSSATSATPSSPGRGRRGRSSGTGAGRTAWTGWWPCTRSRSAPTWPACGWAGTAATRELVGYLREVRKHAGFMVPGPVQQAAAAALGDAAHVAGSGSGTGSAWSGPGTSWPAWGSTVTFRAAGSTCGRRRPAATAGPGPGLAGRARAVVLVSPGSFYGDARADGFCPPGHGRPHRTPGLSGAAASGWADAPGSGRVRAPRSTSTLVGRRGPDRAKLEPDPGQPPAG